MNKKNHKDNNHKKLIGFLMCSAFILVLLKLLFLPFYSTTQREYAEYEKHSPMGSYCSIELAYIEPIAEINQGINTDDQKEHIYYYYGFDENYNVSLVAVKDKYHLAMEKELSNKKNSNKKYYGIIIDSSEIITYSNGKYNAYLDNSDHSDLFGNGNNVNEFSSGFNEDVYTSNNVLIEYNVLQLDPELSGTEEVRNGLGVGAYALILATLFFIIAMVLIFMADKNNQTKDKSKKREREKVYYLID